MRRITALVKRDLRATVSDKGRIAELVILPLSAITLWGLLYTSGAISRDTAGSLLVTNVIWVISAQFQTHPNMGQMIDLWSREFVEFFREGIAPGEYIAARIIGGTITGALTLVIFTMILPLCFVSEWKEIRLLYETLPVYYVSSIGLSLFVAGSVVRLGRSYAFLSWTSLQVVMTFSAPYSPVEHLPRGLKFLSWLSPYTYVFEFVRGGDFGTLIQGGLLALVFCAAGYAWWLRCFNAARAGPGLGSL